MSEAQENAGKSRRFSQRPYKVDFKELVSGRCSSVGVYENMRESECYLYLTKLIQKAERQDRFYEELLAAFAARIRYADGDDKAYVSLKHACVVMGIPFVDLYVSE